MMDNKIFEQDNNRLDDAVVALVSSVLGMLFILVISYLVIMAAIGIIFKLGGIL